MVDAFFQTRRRLSPRAPAAMCLIVDNGF